MPRVSVVITCYNLGEFLDKAVDSVLCQTFQDFEIIIVNDGSTDKITNKILQKYNRPKTRVLWTKNMGLPSARNNGIRESLGEYICCLDADDKYHPDFLKKTVEILDQDNDQRVGFVTTWIRVFGDENYDWKTEQFNPMRLAIENVVHVASLFRKECWDNVGGYALSMREGYEDWNFWISIVGLGYQWACIEEPLFYYRKRKNSMLQSSNEKKTLLFSRIVGNNLTFYQKNLSEILVTATIEIDKAWNKWSETNNRLIAIEKRSIETVNKLKVIQDRKYYLAIRMIELLNKFLPIGSRRRKTIKYFVQLFLKSAR